ncbi:MAG: hypothetical protein IPL67_19315 [Ignavibacteria bacterium]|nr:hypothetical protein [Ignavibacteria bacterium]
MINWAGSQHALSEGFKTAGVYEAAFDASRIVIRVASTNLLLDFEMTKKMLLVK